MPGYVVLRYAEDSRRPELESEILHDTENDARDTIEAAAEQAADRGWDIRFTVGKILELD